jgi:hypothetical protein
LADLLKIPPDSILWVHKALPGLRQSSHAWNKELGKHLQQGLGLKPNDMDPCVYIKLDEDGVLLGAIHVWVDDNTYFGPRSIVDELKAAVTAKYPQEDNGPAKGLQITRDRANRHICIHQTLKSMGYKISATPIHVDNQSTIKSLTDKKCPQRQKFVWHGSFAARTCSARL